MLLDQGSTTNPLGRGSTAMRTSGWPSTSIATVPPEPSRSNETSTSSAPSRRGTRTQADELQTRAAQREALRNAVKPSSSTALSGTRVAGMESWTGYVTAVDDDLFSAELVPGQSGPRVVGDFPLELLGTDDALAVGDVVYVTVRTVLGPGGAPMRTQAIRRRRLGRWSQEEISSHAARAQALHESLGDLID